eukprot:127470-Prymnesium_polylepis.1
MQHLGTGQGSCTGSPARVNQAYKCPRQKERKREQGVPTQRVRSCGPDILAQGPGPRTCKSVRGPHAGRREEQAVWHASGPRRA